MTPEQFENLSEAEFGQLVESHITSVAQGGYDLPADIFWDSWVEKLEAEAEETVTLSIDIQGKNGLQILPDREWGDVTVRGNEIFIGRHKLVLTLAE
jgi:hypothetical protein